MENLTKKDILKILNTYQNYINDFVNISDEDLTKMYQNLDIKQTKELNPKQLLRTSQYINEQYNLDTWVNETTNTIWLSVWNKELTDSYDIEMSKEQTEQFYNEIKPF